MTNKSNTQSSILEETPEAKEIRELKAKIAELTAYTTEEESVPEIKLSQDDYIKVMSLCPDGWHVNLSTLGNGQGRIYKFTRFGEIKNIRYGDLNDIIEANYNFLESGRFYILNRNVVRHHGLDSIYSQILTKEKINQIIEGSDEAVELYQSCNEKQQELIIDMVTEKLRDNPGSVDLNIVDKLSKVSKIKIMERSEDSKNLKESMIQK